MQKMNHSFLSLVFFGLIFNSSVHSDLLQELDAFVAPEDRDDFHNSYHNLTDLLKDINIGDVFHAVLSGSRDNKTCHTCLEVFPVLKSFLLNTEIAITFAKSICKNTTYFSETICLGYLENFSEHIVYIIQNTKLNVPEVCSTFLHPDCMKHFGEPMTEKIEWVLPLPHISKRSQFSPKSVNDKPLKMLHLTDIHLDLWYIPESSTECAEPMCCRSNGTKGSAGYWGEVYGNCDIPLNLVKSTVDHIKDYYNDIDLIIWTGDTVPHEGWMTSREDTLRHIKSVTDLLKEGLNETKVFACLGNHDTHPMAMYVPHEVSQKNNPNISMSWLYDTLADDYWEQYLDTESAKHTFKRSGYYSSKIRDNIKVIVLNNNHCFSGNYWKAYDPVDPDGQLQFLIDELDLAEKENIYAMIIGHIPPNGCFEAWKSNYIRIVDRFQHLIVGTYWGHTHKDEFVVFYNKNESIPVSLAYVGPSLTTGTHLNPAYRVYTLDNNGKPLDFETYYTDMIDDNNNGSKAQPIWKKAFSAKESYGLTSLSTESWDQFITKAKTDDNLTKLFFKHYHRFSKEFEEQNDVSLDHQRKLLQNERSMP